MDFYLYMEVVLEDGCSASVKIAESTDTAWDKHDNRWFGEDCRSLILNLSVEEAKEYLDELEKNKDKYGYDYFTDSMALAKNWLNEHDLVSVSFEKIKREQER